MEEEGDADYAKEELEDDPKDYLPFLKDTRGGRHSPNRARLGGQMVYAQNRGNPDMNVNSRGCVGT